MPNNTVLFLFICSVVFLSTCGIIIVRSGVPKEDLPCSYFKDVQVQHLPARCLKEFQGK